MLFLLAKVPLADQTCRIASCAHHVRDRGFRRGHAHIGVAPGDVELKPVTLLVPAGVQARARRAANRCGHVAIGEAHALRGEGVDVGSLDHGAAIGPDVAPAEVVRHHDDHVGGSRRDFTARGSATATECQREQETYARSHRAAILAECSTNPNSANRMCAPLARIASTQVEISECCLKGCILFL